jgi:hypothetical protein
MEFNGRHIEKLFQILVRTPHPRLAPPPERTPFGSNLFADEALWVADFVDGDGTTRRCNCLVTIQLRRALVTADMPIHRLGIGDSRAFSPGRENRNPA